MKHDPGRRILPGWLRLTPYRRVPLAELTLVDDAEPELPIPPPLFRSKPAMRAMAYVVAALAAVGIMISIALIPKASNPEPIPAATVSTSHVMEEPGTLVLSVPAMHCEFACFPSVKEILEADVAVDAVELAQQKEEGTIDNRQVIVKYDAGFDVDAAIASLGKNGFEKSDVVQ